MITSLLSAVAFAATASAHCTFADLKQVVDVYLATQVSGQVAPLKARIDNGTWTGYYENSKKLEIDTGIVSKALPITHNRTIYDTSVCSTYSEIIVNSTTDPYVIGTQLRYANHKINRIDSIVTKPGDWLFNVTGYAYWVTQENWGPIPESKRDTRNVIRAAADSYLDLFNNPNVTVPWGTPCVRLEGGLYGDPGPNGTCAEWIPTGVPITRRRYVIDESLGAVEVMVDFGKSAWPDSHEFRIEGGKIRYVHTLTHCGTPNCGV